MLHLAHSWAKPKPGAWNTVQWYPECHMGGRNPSAWVVNCCLHGQYDPKLGQKWRSRELNQALWYRIGAQSGDLNIVPDTRYPWASLRFSAAVWMFVTLLCLPQCSSLWWWHCEDRALLDGVGAFVKETPGRALAHSPRWGCGEKTSLYGRPGPCQLGLCQCFGLNFRPCSICEK